MSRSLDRAFGLVNYVKQRRIPAQVNTFGRMRFYEDVPRAELFPKPVPKALPRVVRSSIRSRLTKLEFLSAHEPLHTSELDRYRDCPELHRFVVRRFRRPGRPPKRAVVYLHAWMVDGAHLADSTFALWISQQLDADVFAVEQVHHGSRKMAISPYGGAHFFSADVAMTFESMRQAASDARLVVDHVLDLGWYDEVGMLGVSLGGAIALIVACHEPRLDWVVPVVSHLNIADTVHHAPIAVRARRQLQSWGVSMSELRRVNDALLGWLEPALPRERILMMPARRDLCMRAVEVERLLLRWPGVRANWLPGGHISSVMSLAVQMPRMRSLLQFDGPMRAA